MFSEITWGLKSLHFKVVVICAVIFLTVAIWFSSGTLAPYATTLYPEGFVEPCHYLVNTDNWVFESTFKILNGVPVSETVSDQHLRRILYPLLSYPFMKIFGFLAGGFVLNLIVHLGAFVSFTVFVRKRFGDQAAIWSAWLLASYPGITYWSSLPYCYALIVPGCLLLTMLTLKLLEIHSLCAFVALSAVMGIVFLSYDLLLIFFAPTAFFVIAKGKGIRRALLATLISVLAYVTFTSLTFFYFKIAVSNTNTNIYRDILLSYLNGIRDLNAWWGEVRRLPIVFVKVFLTSNFIFLPILFLICILVNRKQRMIRVTTFEKAFLMSILLFFLFNNLAPPYRGVFVMRGEWIARLYQASFVAMILICARVLSNPSTSIWLKRVGMTIIVVNASVIFGAVFRNPLTQGVYHRFYWHGSFLEGKAYYYNLDRYGIRPLGFCNKALIQTPVRPGQ